MARSRRLLRPVILACVLSSAACGEEFTSGTGGSGGVASGGVGGATGGNGGGPPGACPAAQPAAGTPCDAESLLCTFGSDARPNCRVHVRCASGAWSIVREPNCPISLPCDVATVTGKQCLTPGDECSDANRYCACTCTVGTCSGYTWKCPPTGPNCPTIVPNAGTGCSAEGASCTYGVCDDTTPLHDQVVVTCQNGSWAWTGTSCLQ